MPPEGYSYGVPPGPVGGKRSPAPTCRAMMPTIASRIQRRVFERGWAATAPAASTASLPISGPSASRMRLSASVGFSAGVVAPFCGGLSVTVSPLAVRRSLEPSEEARDQSIYPHSAQSEAGKHARDRQDGYRPSTPIEPVAREHPAQRRDQQDDRDL